jgi:hypothetical protein
MSAGGVEKMDTSKEANSLCLNPVQLVQQSFFCTMPKRQSVVIFSEVNYELSLVMENVKKRAGGNPPALQK